MTSASQLSLWLSHFGTLGWSLWAWWGPWWPWHMYSWPWQCQLASPSGLSCCASWQNTCSSGTWGPPSSETHVFVMGVSWRHLCTISMTSCAWVVLGLDCVSPEASGSRGAWHQKTKSFSSLIYCSISGPGTTSTNTLLNESTAVSVPGRQIKKEGRKERGRRARPEKLITFFQTSIL